MLRSSASREMQKPTNESAHGRHVNQKFNDSFFVNREIDKISTFQLSEGGYDDCEVDLCRNHSSILRPASSTKDGNPRPRCFTVCSRNTLRPSWRGWPAGRGGECKLAAFRERGASPLHGLDGTKALVFAPEVFIEKLCAVIPPPRQNLVSYFGVFAPNAALRRSRAADPCRVWFGRLISDTHRPKSALISADRGLKRLGWVEEPVQYFRPNAKMGFVFLIRLAELLRTSRRSDFSRGKEKDGIALIKTARNFGCAFSIIQ